MIMLCWITISFKLFSNSTLIKSELPEVYREQDKTQIQSIIYAEFVKCESLLPYD